MSLFEAALATSALNRASPRSRELARWVCLPVRISRALVRSARQRFMPDYGPEVEAELWFGPLVESFSETAITLAPGVARALRGELASDLTALDRARQLVAEIQGAARGQLARVEEELIDAALRSDTDRARTSERFLRPLVKTILEGRATVNARRWASGLRKRVPEIATEPAAVALETIAKQSLPGLEATIDFEAVAALPPLERGLLTRGAPKPAELGIAAIGDELIVRRPPAPDDNVISTAGDTIELHEVTSGRENRIISLPPPDSGNSSTELSFDATLPLVLTFGNGEQFSVESLQQQVDGLQDILAPYRVEIEDDSGTVLGTGLLVAEQVIATAGWVPARAFRLGEELPRLSAVFRGIESLRIDIEQRSSATSQDGVVFLRLLGPMPSAPLQRAPDQPEHLTATTRMVVAQRYNARTERFEWASFTLDGSGDAPDGMRLIPHRRSILEDATLYAGSPVVQLRPSAVIGIAITASGDLRCVALGALSAKLTTDLGSVTDDLAELAAATILRGPDALDDLGKVQRSLDLKRPQHVEIAIKILEAYRNWSRDDEAISLAEWILSEAVPAIPRREGRFAEFPDVALIYAGALGRRNQGDDLRRAIDFLDSAVRRMGDSAEFCGLLGYLYTKSYRTEHSADDDPSHTHLDPRLDLALDQYRRGAAADLNDFYCALKFVELAIEFIGQDWLPEIQSTAAAACSRLKQRAERTDDIWLLLAAVELCAVADDWLGVSALIPEIAKRGLHSLQAETVIKTLAMIDERKLPYLANGRLPKLMRDLQAICDNAYEAPAKTEYDFDVFVSYSSRDDRDESGYRWVSELVAALRRRLEMMGGRPLRFFFDLEQVTIRESWADAIAMAVRRSKLLLAVVSPTSVADRHVAYELDVFLSRSEQDDSLQRPPILMVVKEPTESNRLPVPLRGMAGYTFYARSGTRTATYDPRNADFAREVDKLARNIIDALSSNDTPTVRRQLSVYLIYAKADAFIMRIREELDSRGFAVIIPLFNAPAGELRAHRENELKNCDVVVIYDQGPEMGQYWMQHVIDHLAKAVRRRKVPFRLRCMIGESPNHETRIRDVKGFYGAVENVVGSLLEALSSLDA